LEFEGRENEKDRVGTHPHRVLERIQVQYWPIGSTDRVSSASLSAPVRVAPGNTHRTISLAFGWRQRTEVWKQQSRHYTAFLCKAQRCPSQTQLVLSSPASSATASFLPVPRDRRPFSRRLRVQLQHPSADPASRSNLRRWTDPGPGVSWNGSEQGGAANSRPS